MSHFSFEYTLNSQVQIYANDDDYHIKQFSNKAIWHYTDWPRWAAAPLILSWLYPYCSVFGGHMECHWVISGEWFELTRAPHRGTSWQTRVITVHHFLSTQQTTTKYFPDSRDRECTDVVELAAGCLWSVSIRNILLQYAILIFNTLYWISVIISCHRQWLQLKVFHWYFRDGKGRLRVFSVKVSLSTLCSGKLMDKLRCKLMLQYCKYRTTRSW